MNTEKTLLKENSSSIFIQAIFDAFDENGIPYCVLRNYEDLPYEHGNDVDICVHQTFLKKTAATLNHVSEQNNWHLFAHSHRHGYDGFHFFQCNQRILIDIFTQCHWRGLLYSDVDYILKTKQQYKAFWVASSGCEAAVTLAKDLLQRGLIKEKNNARAKIQKGAIDDKVGFIECLTKSFGEKLAESTWENAKDGEWNKIESELPRLRNDLISRSLFPFPFKQLGVWVCFVLGHLSYKLKRPLGCFVVIIGPDGSGKTTIANGVMSFWKESFHKKPYYIHGDFGLLPRLKILRVLIAKIRGRKAAPDVDYTQRHSGANVKPHSLFRSLLYLSYYFWGYILGYFKIFRAKSEDRLVVADRYFYDYFFQRGNMELPHVLLRVMNWFIPEPDLVVFLDADAEAIHARKDELTIEEIQRQKNIITGMRKWLPNIIVVKAEDNIESTVDSVKMSIMKKMMDE